MGHVVTVELHQFGGTSRRPGCGNIGLTLADRYGLISATVHADYGNGQRHSGDRIRPVVALRHFMGKPTQEVRDGRATHACRGTRAQIEDSRLGHDAGDRDPGRGTRRREGKGRPTPRPR